MVLTHTFTILYRSEEALEKLRHHIEGDVTFFKLREEPMINIHTADMLEMERKYEEQVKQRAAICLLSASEKSGILRWLARNCDFTGIYPLYDGSGKHAIEQLQYLFYGSHHGDLYGWKVTECLCSWILYTPGMTVDDCLHRLQYAAPFDLQKLRSATLEDGSPKIAMPPLITCVYDLEVASTRFGDEGLLELANKHAKIVYASVVVAKEKQISTYLYVLKPSDKAAAFLKAKQDPYLEKTQVKIMLYESEEELIRALLTRLSHAHIVSGWNTSGFDNMRLGLRAYYLLGEGDPIMKEFMQPSRMLPPSSPNPRYMRSNPFHNTFTDGSKAKSVLKTVAQISIDGKDLKSKLLGGIKGDSLDVVGTALELGGKKDLYNVSTIMKACTNVFEKGKDASQEDLEVWSYGAIYNTHDSVLTNQILESVMAMCMSLMQIAGATIEDVFYSTAKLPHVRTAMATVALQQDMPMHQIIVINGGQGSDFSRDKILPDGRKYQGAAVSEIADGRHLGMACELDFNSLYPNIARGHLLSPSFVEVIKKGKKVEWAHELTPSKWKSTTLYDQMGEEFGELVSMAHRPKFSLPLLGYFSKMLTERKAIKGAMKAPGLDATTKMVLDGHQNVLKLCANGAYGITGESGGHFYALGTAAGITHYGQEAIRATWEVLPNIFTNVLEEMFPSSDPNRPVASLASDTSPRIIAGDTDSGVVFAPILVPMDAMAKFSKELERRCNDWLDETYPDNVLKVEAESVVNIRVGQKKKRYAMAAIADGYFKMKGYETSPDPAKNKALKNYLRLLLFKVFLRCIGSKPHLLKHNFVREICQEAWKYVKEHALIPTPEWEDDQIPHLELKEELIAYLTKCGEDFHSTAALTGCQPLAFYKNPTAPACLRALQGKDGEKCFLAKRITHPRQEASQLDSLITEEMYLHNDFPLDVETIVQRVPHLLDVIELGESYLEDEKERKACIPVSTVTINHVLDLPSFKDIMDQLVEALTGKKRHDILRRLPEERQCQLTELEAERCNVMGESGPHATICLTNHSIPTNCRIRYPEISPNNLPIKKSKEQMICLQTHSNIKDCRVLFPNRKPDPLLNIRQHVYAEFKKCRTAMLEELTNTFVKYNLQFAYVWYQHEAPYTSWHTFFQQTGILFNDVEFGGMENWPAQRGLVISKRRLLDITLRMVNGQVEGHHETAIKGAPLCGMEAVLVVTTGFSETPIGVRIKCSPSTPQTRLNLLKIYLAALAKKVDLVGDSGSSGMSLTDVLNHVVASDTDIYKLILTPQACFLVHRNSLIHSTTSLKPMKLFIDEFLRRKRKSEKSATSEGDITTKKANYSYDEAF